MKIHRARFTATALLIGLCSLAVIGCDDQANAPECALNSDCPSPRVCRAQACVFECIEARDCEGELRCFEGRCIENEPPMSTLDMSLDPLPECRLNSDCAPGLSCEQERCVAPPGSCQQNSDCATGEACERDMMRCVQVSEPGACTDEGDCFAGERCEEGRCVSEPPPPCELDLECSAGQVCEAGDCVPACVVGQCPDGLLCRAGRCQPECVFQSDCPEPYICQASACVLECEEDSDCFGDQLCVKNRCEDGCMSDAECDAPLVCRERACVPECEQDSSCEEGWRCEGQRCVEEGCDADAECDAPLVCRERACVPECQTDPECGENQRCVEQSCIEDVSPYQGSFLISSSTPIQRCNPTLSVNYDPRVAQVTHTPPGFSLHFPNPATTYVGQMTGLTFSVSWSGPNGADLNCGALTSSNRYDATFTSADLFQGTLTIDFFFQVGACNCQIVWPVVGVRQ